LLCSPLPPHTAQLYRQFDRQEEAELGHLGYCQKLPLLAKNRLSENENGSPIEPVSASR
jgi:hypothetical protein